MGLRQVSGFRLTCNSAMQSKVPKYLVAIPHSICLQDTMAFMAMPRGEVFQLRLRHLPHRVSMRSTSSKEEVWAPMAGCDVNLEAAMT